MADRPSSGRARFWCDAVILLSLDLTSLFVKELRLEHLYSDELRTIARGVIPAIDLDDTFDSWFTDLLQLEDRFRESISGKLGDEALRELIDWENRAFPPEEVGDMHETRSLAGVLTHKWTESSTLKGLPLGGSHQVHLRVRLRDYVSHSDNVFREIIRAHTYFFSEWDERIDLRHDLTRAQDLIWVAFYNLEGQAFLEQMQERLAEDEAAELGRWMRSFARKEGIDWVPPLLFRPKHGA